MMKTRQQILRAILRFFGKLIEKTLTRTTVTGAENIPTDAVVIFAANHASTYDALLLLNHLPLDVQVAGPGDFELLFPTNHIINSLGIILIQRGTADRDSLKQMIAVLKGGQRLALAPEGGTWEKRLDDVKSGAAYLSLMTETPIVPVALGGTYQVWEKIFRFERPWITLHFAPPMPPVTSTDRKTRQDDLRKASLNLMKLIYEHLPPEEQARYDLHARQEFSATLEFAPALMEHSGDYSVLAELISKPNLFSPLHRNLGLPLEPLVNHGKFYPAAQFEATVGALREGLSHTVPNYLNYRLGDRKAQKIMEELDDLKLAGREAARLGAAISFTPHVQILDSPTPPNS